jgi:hypothetical protein
MKIKILEVNRIEQKSMDMNSIKVKYEVDGEVKGTLFVDGDSALDKDKFIERIKEKELKLQEEKVIKTEISTETNKVITPITKYNGKEVEI